ncbi:hypothetical protein SAMN06265795_106126 [Noviherbaspirillum humi]|uniref:Uncharacterized protein n=1 Tax=Noviherbaspirillum humi TaxID=1688639 RepID=A0A239H8X4_9BURK|nr:hypothetical protein [Noviherbaspirillum humi]SNS77263.1 hypothetical protein SAMN06265795_106126 [Noviherbaspirillum humi]
MDLLWIELILWAAMLVLLWAMKDGLGRIESEIQASGPAGRNLRSNWAEAPAFVQATDLEEQIGILGDAPIYRYAVINGECYQFDHVLPARPSAVLRADQRCIAPGLVYVRYERQPVSA